MSEMRGLTDTEVETVCGGVSDLGKYITKAVDDAISAAIGGNSGNPGNPGTPGYYPMPAYGPPMKVVPLTKEKSGPRLAYYITMGVRGADQEWKRQLNRLITENQPAINGILSSFGVPLLDDKGQPIGGVAPLRQ